MSANAVGDGFGGGGVDADAFTLSVNAVVCDCDPEVPVMVIGYVPAGVDAAAEIVKVDVQPGVQDPAEKTAVAPDGSPEATKETDCGVPDVVVAVTLSDIDCP